MTKKDYELLAKAVKRQFDFFGENESVMTRFAVYLATDLENTNERFDRKRFLRACGVEA